MANTTYLCDLYEKAVTLLTQNAEEWTGLLSSVAKFYKLSYDKNVLIYMQKPEAGLIATMRSWNIKTGRYVNKYSKAIAVLDMSDPKAKLSYYFDFSDTHGDMESFQKTMELVWKVENQYKSDLLAHFQDRFGVTGESIEEVLAELVEKRIKEVMPPYMEHFSIREEASVLYGAPVEAVRAEFVDYVQNSALYIVLKKCGLPTECIGPEVFANISNYGSLELFMQLGACSTGIARPILRQVYQEIEDIKNERSRLYEQRSITASGLHRGRGRNDVSGPGNLEGTNLRSDTGRKVREDLEGLYVGTKSGASYGTDYEGRNQSDDYQSGRGSGGEERNTDPEITGTTAVAGDGRPYGENRSHGNADTPGGGSYSPGSSVPGEIIQDSQKAARSDEGKEPLSDRAAFFKASYTDEEIRVFYEDILMDTRLYPEELYEKINWVMEEKTPLQEKARDIRELYESYGDAEDRTGKTRVVLKEETMQFYFGEGGFTQLTWHQVAHAIKLLIEDGDYIPLLPHTDTYINDDEEAQRIGDFNIPGEIDEMEGVGQNVWEEYRKTETPVRHINVSRPESDSQMDLFSLGMTGPSTSDVEGVLSGEESRSVFLSFEHQGEQPPVGDSDSKWSSLPPEEGVSTESSIEDQATTEQFITDQSTPTAVSSFFASEGEKAEHMEAILAGAAGRSNYVYSDDHHLYDGGPKEKCGNNIAAIRLMKQLEEENRHATKEEQLILAKYVGWGGLANALTPGKSGWERQYDMLKQLLTDEEMQSAAESTLTAYYTEQNIIRHIYTALERFGFRKGNILDPAMGTGNFYSVLPEIMRESELYGIEIDRLSGGIAKELYPNAHIEIQGYEDTELSDNYFDVAVGNIPFNSIRISDRRYDRYGFRIHDYFIAKTLDKVRPGGMIVFITSKFTMDKKNPTIRKYIAQRAELIGAIRLPKNAFSRSAGTAATTDILFLQKRDQEIIPDQSELNWLSVEEDSNGVPVNSYFIDHPEMILGTMSFDASMYSNEKSTSCLPYEDQPLDELLQAAVRRLQATYREPDTEVISDKETDVKVWLPARPEVKNGCYALIDGQLYYREDSRMYLQTITGKKEERIKGLLPVKQALWGLINYQSKTEEERLAEGLPWNFEEGLDRYLKNLNQVYDTFVAKYGYINSAANISAFAKDSDAPLLRSVEDPVKDAGGKVIKGEYQKAIVFSKPTIKPKIVPKHADSAQEALKLSLNMKGRVDLDYIQYLYHTPDHENYSKDEIIAELGTKIYQDPAIYQGDPYKGWVMAEEYLSGYVKDKLKEAVFFAGDEPERFGRNVEALKQVQPQPLTPADISFVLGSTWIPIEYYEEFMYEKLETPGYLQNSNNDIHIEYMKHKAEYHITNKSAQSNSVLVNTTYGTSRKNAYEILETSLNLRTVEVRDRVEYMDPATGEDKVKYVLNRSETLLAREKQAQIKTEFETWLFEDPERGATLTKLYNELFNNVRPREFHGDDLMLPDLSSAVQLRKSQKDAVARGIFGNTNVLAAHEVGGGKTFIAIVIAHERKRLGICNKPLIAVPNHLVGQWADEYMRLYPQDNLLVARGKDFEAKNRRRFVSRIATGDYDAIIMAHSSFELINLSKERQLAAIQEELDEISNMISEEKSKQGKSWTLKQLYAFKKNLQFRYDSLFNEEKKDNTINFEQLGVDNLIVDEAHVYKNNYSYTKMRNVAGVGGQSSQRAMDMYMKAQYINEITDERGLVYLTGTPVTNSMSELYVMQKTLQPSELKRRGLYLFDSWASTFGVVEASLEIRPEGTGYQMKNRFARFHNLPELLTIFSLVADIKTADMLPEVPAPKLRGGAMQAIKTMITPAQKEKMAELVMRAENIRNGVVDSTEDNFLKLTNEARLLAVDPRILDPSLPCDPDTKLNKCARKVAHIYHETAEKKSTQLIFCDKGTPKRDGSFNFYDAIKAELIANGVLERDVVFIHDYETDSQKRELYERVKSGEIRILMGSTEKMGTGMNVQDKLITLHHLDVPWRPADLTQRNGRALRQGNENEEIQIYTYITEQTFDSYLWQILEQKQKYISQIMTRRSSARSCGDIDETVLQYAEFKALAADPRIKHKMEVDNEIYRLQTLKASWKTRNQELQNEIVVNYPQKIEQYESRLEKYRADIERYQQNKPEDFSMTLEHKIYMERVKAGEHMELLFRKLGRTAGDTLAIGTYAGFGVSLSRGYDGLIYIGLNGKGIYTVCAGESALGNIVRLENLANRFEEHKKELEYGLSDTKKQFESAKQELSRPFKDEERLAELLKEQVRLALEIEFQESEKEPTNSDKEDNQKKLNEVESPCLSRMESVMEEEWDR